MQGRCTGTRFAVTRGVRHPIFSAVATAWLVLLSAFEIFHFARGVPWQGYTHVVNYISFLFVAFFLTGCAYLLRYQMRRPVWPMIAFGAAIIQGVIIRAGGGWQGYVLLVSGVVLMISGFTALKYRIVRESRHDVYTTTRKVA